MPTAVDRSVGDAVGLFKSTQRRISVGALPSMAWIVSEILEMLPPPACRNPGMSHFFNVLNSAFCYNFDLAVIHADS